MLNKFHRSLHEKSDDLRSDMYVNNIVSSIQMLQHCMSEVCDPRSFNELLQRRRRMIKHLCNVDEEYRKVLMDLDRGVSCSCDKCMQDKQAIS